MTQFDDPEQYPAQESDDPAPGDPEVLSEGYDPILVEDPLAATIPDRKARRRKRIDDHFRTRDYYLAMKEGRRSRGSKFL